MLTPKLHPRMTIRWCWLATRRASVLKPHDFTPSEEDIHEVNRRYEGRIRIDKGPHGWGLTSMRQWQQGDRVMASRAVYETSEKDSHTLQIDWNRHVLMDVPAVLINHSCDANVGLRVNGNGAFDFVAMRQIHEEEALLLDYETAEYEVEGFTCSCGSPMCRQSVRGFRYNGNEVLQKYGPEFVVPYLLDKQ